MGLIYYKGEQYTEPPLTLANAILLSDEDREKYNIVVNDSDVHEVVMDSGERFFLGDPDNNFIAQGYNIVKAESEEAFLAKIQPNDAYTNIDIEEGWTSLGEYDSDWFGGSQIKLAYIELTSSKIIAHYQYRSSDNSWSTSDLNLTAPPAAVGYVFRCEGITSYGCRARLYEVSWIKNENDEYVVNDWRKVPLTGIRFRENEYEYALGITGKYSYLTEAEWEAIVNGT